MAKQWKLDYLPGKNQSKNGMVYVPTGLEIGADEISVYLGDNVPVSAQVIIVNAWEWLYNGVVERNLLDKAPWAGAILYTGSNWNKLTAADRRTESLLATLTEDDIIIGIGANVTALGDQVFLRTAFRRLREFAMEQTLKAA